MVLKICSCAPIHTFPITQNILCYNCMELLKLVETRKVSRCSDLRYMSYEVIRSSGNGIKQSMRDLFLGDSVKD